MSALTVGQRICSYLDGSPRYGRVARLEAGAVICTFEDEADPIDYAMQPGEVYAVGESEAK